MLIYTHNHADIVRQLICYLCSLQCVPSTKMLVRNLSRALWKTLRVEKRCFASEPVKPQPESSDNVEPVQVCMLYLVLLKT